MGPKFQRTDLPLVARLKELGWTQQRLADESGFNVRTIINWTAGARTPSPGQNARLARALGCTVEEIRDPHPGPQRPTNPRGVNRGAARDDALARWQGSKR